MSEFTTSGLYGLPILTADYLAGKDQKVADRVSSWITEAIQEGDLINESDPQYEHIAPGMAYSSGDQLPPPDNATIPQYLQQVQIDLCTKAMRAHVSALTDLKPVAGWRSENPKYQFHAHLLNRLVMTWWVTRLADVQLGDVVKYSWATGTGDAELAWDPTLEGGGDHVLVARDCRDTLPIRPGKHRNPQDWKGLVLRDVWSVNAMRDKYPLWASHIHEASGGILSTIRGWFFSSKPRMMSPADPMGLAGQPRRMGPPRPGECVLYRAFLDDRTRNSTARPIVMGDPGTNWCYTVNPGELLYPNKRLICRVNDDLIVYDGPSPYWHGRYPVARLMLWSLPWFFLGISQLRTLKPLQNAVNDSVQQHRLGIRRWMEPATMMNKQAVGDNFVRMFDVRKPAQKINVSGIATRLEDAFKTVDGPNPQVLQMNFNMYQEFIQRFEYLSGTANLQQLMQLRQLPGADTIQKYYEALTPEIRDEGRAIESFIRTLSPMLLYNTFQFMDKSRRVHLLGDAGLALEDFDYDPDLLVPSLPKFIEPSPEEAEQAVLSGMPPIPKENPEYDPLFDAGKSRTERAKAMARLMTFIVAPNTLLAMHDQEKKMEKFQLARMGYYDFWSLMEALDIGNVGVPMPIPLPPLRPPAPEELIEGLMTGRYMLNPAIAGQLAGTMFGSLLGPGAGAPGTPGTPGQAPNQPPPQEGGAPAEGDGAGGPPQAAQAPADPAAQIAMLQQILTVPGAILELRIPITVTERLQAQQMMGIGMTENPAGRKASGGSEPKLEQKSDGAGGQRSTVTESSKSRNQ